MRKFICFFSLLILFGFKHPFYLGVTEIKYAPKQKTFQISIKLFTNDLETALQNLTNKKVDLIHPKDSNLVSKQLNDYVHKRLIIKANNKPVDYNYVGFEREQESFWIYFESKRYDRPKQLYIENNLLYDFIKEQINIIHLEIEGRKWSLKATNPEKVFKFSIK